MKCQSLFFFCFFFFVFFLKKGEKCEFVVEFAQRGIKVNC